VEASRPSNQGGTDGKAPAAIENDARPAAGGPVAAGPHPPRIGPFRILAPIGEGAMGIVYEAEQERPTRRVALKILRPGLIPTEVMRRFELEYEFLGRLHHPGIAQIFQAGVEDTAYGAQPYFAMELVVGKRLDEYIRDRHPALRERLLLVAAIADAVQHAHHRGIIHRDLKPANILVTDAGEPKVLDFGIARAAHAGLMTTVQTGAGEVLGTISYMSPEQVSGDLSALDTRSDVYALGVILYEVLAERPPYELDRKPFAEAARIIHEEEPTRLRTAAGAVPADVETIVIKALEKEKERRYNSAADLADDIRRFLRDEPIAARPPSAAYQVRKYARRHKAIVAGVIACLVVLAAGVAATAWQAVRATRAERIAAARAHEAELERAKAEAVTSFLTQMLGSVDPSRAQGRDVTVREALDSAAAKIDAGAMAKQPEVEVAVRNEIGSTYGSLGVFDAAERQLRQAIALGSQIGAPPLVRADSHARLVNVLYGAGKSAAAVPIAQEALRLRRETLGPTHADVASSLDDLGAVIMATGDATRAEPLMRESLAIRRQVLSPDDPLLAVGLNNLAFLIWRKGNPQEAEAMFREALAIDRKTLGNLHPEVLTRLLNIAVVMRDQQRSAEAEPLAREGVEGRRKVLGAEHREFAEGMDVLAGVLEDQGRYEEAEKVLREALAVSDRKDRELTLTTARLQHNLGWMLWKRGEYEEAEPLLRAGVINLPKTYGPAHRFARLAVANLARDLNSLGRTRAGESTAREALALYRKAPADQAVATALLALGQALLAQRRLDEAAPLLREAVDVIADRPPVRFPWIKGDAQSTLGGVLAAQGQNGEAEKLLLAGYENLKSTPSAPPPLGRAAIERIVAFYTARGRTADAAAWRARLRE
jgi:eukaryotic-like serine/threonine-protein kinase